MEGLLYPLTQRAVTALKPGISWKSPETLRSPETRKNPETLAFQGQHPKS
jgi:hypothetical protein